MTRDASHHKTTEENTLDGARFRIAELEALLVNRTDRITQLSADHEGSVEQAEARTANRIADWMNARGGFGSAVIAGEIRAGSWRDGTK